MGMILLFFFHLAGLWPKRIPFTTSVLKTITNFYVTATVLNRSITTASLVSFWNRRSISDSLYANFGYVDFYVNSMLALAPPLSVMPAVVLVMMPSKVRNARKHKLEMKLWDEEEGKNTNRNLALLTVTILYIYCIVVMWIIWSIGLKDQQNPTRIDFGGGLKVRVSSFIYEHASTYIFLVCVLMSALPTAGLAVRGTLWAWHSLHRTEAEPKNKSLSIFRDGYRFICYLLGIIQFGMFAYIRQQAIHQAGGETSETDWGFGQILVAFTWLPLLLSIGYEITSTIVN
jgi:hypothetical protein